LVLWVSLPAKAADLLVTSSSLASTDATQLGRLSRTGVASDWSASKAFPTTINPAVVYHYKTFSVAVGTTSFVQIELDDPNAVFLASAYLDFYSPGSQATNYLGDAGTSGDRAGSPIYFQVAVPANHTVVVVINEVTANGGVGSSFGLRVEGFNDTLYTNPASSTVSVTIATSPSGLFISVDGVSYTAPQTFHWSPGSSHPIATTSPQAGAPGTQYVWSSWSDGNPNISHSVTAPASGSTTYTATFTTQYFLTMNSAAGGAVSPQSGWFNSGQVVQISAMPNPGYTFVGWAGSGTGSFSGSTNPMNITMNGPITEVASFFNGTGAVGLQFVPVTPCRIMDTRNPNSSFGGPFIGGGSTRGVPIPFSGCSIPSAAQAYALNITVIPRAGFLGYLTVWPTGQAQPVVSTLNSFDGSVLANAAIVPAGAGGSINAFATNDTDLLIDINGYFITPGGSSLQFYPLAPCRVLDTRNPTGTFGGPSLAGGTSRSFPIPSSGCGAPVTAAAYSLNVTVGPHGGLGFLTAWPTGQSQPVVSTLNSFDGTILANAAIVPAGTGGAVSFFVTNTTDLVVDIDGYFAPPGAGGLNFYTVTPCRVVDTRNANGPLGGPTMNGDTTRTFPMAGICGLPGIGAAYSVNMTVVPPAPMGFLTVWPTGLAQPAVSTLNDFKGLAVANAALVPAGGSGSINVFVTNTTDVVIDTNGYFR
jgi:hypothetical protein